MILSLAFLKPVSVMGLSEAWNTAPAGLDARMPGPRVYFEANRGQVEQRFHFIARSPEGQLLITPTEAVLLLTKQAGSDPSPDEAQPASAKAQAWRVHSVRIRFEGANPQAAIAGLETLTGTVNYCVGNDPSGWRSGIPRFAKVQIDQLYPGIQLIYYADDSARLEYDLVLQPGAVPDRVSLRIEGADEVKLGKEGDLRLTIAGEEIRQHKPVIYQMIGGVRKPVAGGYRLEGRARVGFWVGDYNRDLPLVIDPSLSFSTYVRGQISEKIWGVAVDGNGHVWVVGETLSPGLATSDAARKTYLGGRNLFGDGFVARFDNGTNLSYLTYLGGTGADAGFAIAVDTNTGAAFITGYTDSPDFPVFPRHVSANAFQTHLGGTNLNSLKTFPVDAFVTKLNSDGTLAYSTYLGGKGRDLGLGIAIDSASRAYVTGLTESRDFPVANPIQGLYRSQGNTYDGKKFSGGGDAFVSRLNAGGSALEYSTFLGGNNHDAGQGIAVDSANCAYVVGITASGNFPVTNALSGALDGVTNDLFGIDGYISKLSSEGSTLVYSSYIGGRGKDSALAVALDALNNAYLTGYTLSTDFPLTLAELSAWPASNHVNSQVFAMKLNPNGGTNGGFSVVFGGKSTDQGTAIAVDAAQNAYIVGITSSFTNFADLDPSTSLPSGFSATNSTLRKLGRKDAFVVVLDPGGTNVFSAYLGGSANDHANAIALDTRSAASVIAYIAGFTSSKDFPGTTPAAGPGHKRRSSGFLARLLFP